MIAPRYLAPELLKNKCSELDKADIFALGATLYEVASGKSLPREGDRYQAFRQGNITLLPTSPNART